MYICEYSYCFIVKITSYEDAFELYSQHNICT